MVVLVRFLVGSTPIVGSELCGGEMARIFLYVGICDCRLGISDCRIRLLLGDVGMRRSSVKWWFCWWLFGDGTMPVDGSIEAVSFVAFFILGGGVVCVCCVITWSVFCSLNLVILKEKLGIEGREACRDSIVEMILFKGTIEPRQELDIMLAQTKD